MTVTLGDIAAVATALTALGGVFYGAWNLRAIRLRQEVSQAARVYLARRTYNHVFGLVRERYTVLNNSAEPVFEVEFAVATYPRGSVRKRRELLQPGQKWVINAWHHFDATVMDERLTFTDSTGAQWSRNPEGKLLGIRFAPPDVQFRQVPKRRRD